MLFDPAALPVATLRPRASRARFTAVVRGWLLARWSWFRPRAIPCIAALAGMLALLGAAEYLRSFADQPVEQLRVKVVPAHAAGGGGYTTILVEHAPPAR